MPENRFRNYTFAVLLILLGVALLLQQLGIWQIPWSQLVALWPLALILIGLEMLLRRVPMGGLVYIVLAAAILAVMWFAWPALGPRLAARETHVAELPLEGIESASIEISMGVGDLELRPLAEPGLLYRAELLYDPSRTELSESRTLQNGHMTASLRMTGITTGPMFGGATDRLELELSPDVPITLVIDAGVSRSRIDLRGMVTTGLEINSGVGDAHVLLAEGEYEAFVSGGVGTLTIELPAGVGAQVQVQGGLGSVRVDDRFDRIDDEYRVEGAGNIQLRIEGGVGSIRVR
jgi:hypothetical protein